MFNKAQMQHAIVIGGLILTPGCVLAQNDWAPSGFPNIVVPFDAIIGGREAPSLRGLPGAPLYVCHGGSNERYGVQVGKYRNGFTGCDFGFGGIEVSVPDFEFLVADWQPASFGAVPGTAVVGGYDTPTPPLFTGPELYYCRAKVSGPNYQPGKIRTEFGACFIPYGGTEVAETNYEVLVRGIPYTSVTASNGYIPPDAIRGGRDDDGTDLYVCNAFFAGGQHPGKLRSSFKGCDISFGGTENVVATYDVLVPYWAAYPPSALETYAFDFPAGTDVSGAPLHVCRAYHLGGLHPGKTQEAWSTCNFGYGGKETTSGNYDILTTPLFAPR
jgi:hypothetical protein